MIIDKSDVSQELLAVPVVRGTKTKADSWVGACRRPDGRGATVRHVYSYIRLRSIDIDCETCVDCVVCINAACL